MTSSTGDAPGHGTDPDFQNPNAGFSKLRRRSEFEIRARGLDHLPHHRGAAAEGWRVQGHAGRAGAEGAGRQRASIPVPRSRSASCRRAATSSRTTGPASTARPKRSPACSRSAARWSRPSCCGCRPVARSATACASSLVRCWPPKAPSPSSPATAASSCAPSATAPRRSSASRRSSSRSAPASRSASARRCRATTTRSDWAQAACRAGAHRVDLFRQDFAMVVRRPAIPRAARRQRRPAGARTDRRARRLHRRQGWRDRRRSRPEPRHLPGRDPRDRLRSCCCAAREQCQAGESPSGSAPSARPVFRATPTPARTAWPSSARDEPIGRNPLRGRGLGRQPTMTKRPCVVCVNRTPVDRRHRGRPRQARHRLLRLRPRTTPSPRRRRMRSSTSRSTSSRRTCRSRPTARSPISNRSSTRSGRRSARPCARRTVPSGSGSVAEGYRARQSR